jgi:hypothetical protein
MLKQHRLLCSVVEMRFRLLPGATPAASYVFKGAPWKGQRSRECPGLVKCELLDRTGSIHGSGHMEKAQARRSTLELHDDAAASIALGDEESCPLAE